MTPAPKERPLPTHGGEYIRTDAGDEPVEPAEQPEPPAPAAPEE